MSVGSGNYVYEVVPGWGKLPEGWQWKLTSGVTVDANDNVYVFARTEHPVVIFNQDGKFLTSWGEGIFTSPHGIVLDAQGNVFCTDSKDHTVRKFSPKGELVMTLGVKNLPSDTGYDGKNFRSVVRGGAPFNRPTCIAEAPNGDLYVGDGYGNCRVHRFTKDGRLVQSWGNPGGEQGEFVVIHALRVDRTGRVWVADRENGRIQVFSPEGEFLFLWTGLHRPTDLVFDKADHVCVAEANGQVSIFQEDGALLSRWGKDSTNNTHPDEVLGKAHTLTVDSRGDIYVGSADYGFLRKFQRR